MSPTYDPSPAWYEPPDYTGPMVCYRCQCEVADHDAIELEGYPGVNMSAVVCPCCEEVIRERWGEDEE